MGEPRIDVDVLVIGAGPGGIAAAVTAGQAGARVDLVDDAPFAGGQIWRNRGEPGKSKSARRWIDQLERLAGSGAVIWHRQSRVIAAPEQNILLCETSSGPMRVGWKSLILAPGARELFLPFPGWTSPGVLGAGAMQALMKQGLSVSGKRVVVAGSGPLLLAVADLLRSRGAVVPLVLEQAPSGRVNRFAMSLLKTPSKLAAGLILRARLIGCGYITDSYPLRVTASDSYLGLEYRSGTRDRSAECDYFACGFGLIPNTELPQLLGCRLTPGGFAWVDRQMQTTAENVYAIGEVTGIGGLEKALIEGQIAAHSAVNNRTAADKLLPARTTALAFSAKLESTFALRSELLRLATDDTIICRCEDVRLSALRCWASGRDAKLQTRCGMGPCQGRICGPILQHLLGTELPQVRPPIFPAMIGSLASPGLQSPDLTKKDSQD